MRRRGFLLAALCGIAAYVGAGLFINHTSLADRIVARLVLADTAGNADAIVVAGAGVIGDCEPNQNGVQRVLLAARLWRGQRSPFVVFTGGVGRSCPVAVAMAQLAREIGVPASAIWMETGSRSTRENADLSAGLLRSRGVRRVLVVTDRLHARRATGAFARMGFAVERATVPIYAGHDDNLSMLRAGLREYIALFYYRLRGWTADAADPALEEAGLNPPEQTPEAVPVTNPAGPIAVLGASYAEGWRLDAVGDAKVVNLGVTGQQSFELLERFERDVVPLKPRAVILWGFINDFFRGTPGAEDVHQRVRDSYTQMIALARQHGIVPILATELTVRQASGVRNTLTGWVGTILGRTSYQDRINQDVIAANRWIAELAHRERLLLLDVHSTLSQGGGTRRAEYTQADGSHVTPAGYEALTAYARPLLEDHFVVSHTGS